MTVLEGSNQQKMKRLIALAIEATPSSEDSMTTAGGIAEAQPKIFHAWATERLAEQIRIARRASRKPDPYAQFLFGFKSLDDKLPVKGGKVQLWDVTIMDLRRSLKIDRDKVSPIAQRKISLIEQMEPYAKVQRGITLGRVAELRAAGIPPRLAKGERFAQNRPDPTASKRSETL